MSSATQSNARSSGLKPDNWVVVSHLPFSPVYHLSHDEANQKGNKPLRQSALQRVPEQKHALTHGFQFTTRCADNITAYLIQCTGALSDRVCETRCATHSRGLWKGCVVPGEPDVVKQFGYACANCWYNKDKSRCRPLYRKKGGASKCKLPSFSSGRESTLGNGADRLVVLEQIEAEMEDFVQRKGDNFVAQVEPQAEAHRLLMTGMQLLYSSPRVEHGCTR
jgi:hypothetical protein